MPTIKDIARAAGVSPTTVSNVIHGNHSRVSAAKVAEIEAVIQEMGYVPNMSARSLVSSASRIIGVINHLVPDESGGFFQDPFHGALLTGIERELRRHNYYLMMRTIESVSELMSLLTNWSLDGLILTGLFPSDFYESLLGQRTPFLLIDSYIDNPNVLQVRLEDHWGGYLATRYLLKRGHREILFCGPPIYSGGVLAERYRGYVQALGEYGLKPETRNVYAREINLDASTALGKELAERDDFTAIFSTADIMAAGIMAGLRLGGRDVPGEISVVGFDDLQVARITDPQLTTIHQDAVHKGEIAVEMLINAVQEHRTRHQPVVLPVHLVERGSSRDINE